MPRGQVSHGGQQRATAATKQEQQKQVVQDKQRRPSHSSKSWRKGGPSDNEKMNGGMRAALTARRPQLILAMDCEPLSCT